MSRLLGRSDLLPVWIRVSQAPGAPFEPLLLEVVSSQRLMMVPILAWRAGLLARQQARWWQARIALVKLGINRSAGEPTMAADGFGCRRRPGHLKPWLVACSGLCVSYVFACHMFLCSFDSFHRILEAFKRVKTERNDLFRPRSSMLTDRCSIIVLERVVQRRPLGSSEAEAMEALTSATRSAGSTRGCCLTAWAALRSVLVEVARHTALL
jgi:hypothetical protein